MNTFSNTTASSLRQVADMAATALTLFCLCFLGASFWHYLLPVMCEHHLEYSWRREEELRWWVLCCLALRRR